MTMIFERVSTALGTLSPAVPFAMKPYQSTGDLPDMFIDYQLVDSNPEEHADNVETHRTHVVQVSIWSRDGLVSLPDVDAAMVAAGFTKGPWRPLPYDRETRHFGIAKDYIFFEKVL